MDEVAPGPKSSSCRRLEMLDLWQPGHAHLVGIGGSGMRSLARILLDLGWAVTGSDQDAAALNPLDSLGVRIHVGHAAGNVSEETSLVVFSDAIPEENVELRRAGERNLPTLRYFEALGLLAAARETVAVAGTHGKSTVSAMLGSILLGAGADPTLAFGAEPLSVEPLYGAPSRAGKGPLMVVEACEYRTNFLHFHPHRAVLLGIEPDHFDCYPTDDRLDHAFTLFCRAICPDGLLLVRHECSRSRRIAESAPCRIETFGLADDADWQAVDVESRLGCYSFSIRSSGKEVCRVGLQVLGAHQVMNALASAAVATHCGATAEQVAAGLSGWRGLRRRLEPVADLDGVTWVDDYAHHPTEVSAALGALRERYPGRRVFCIYQPHQASRTARLLDETAASLQNAEYVFVTEIFRARERPPLKGEITAADLAARARDLGANVPSLHHPREIWEFLSTRLRSGDIVATLGAGNIREIGNEFVFRIREDRAAG